MAAALVLGFPALSLSADIESIVQEAYLKASDTESQDQFGYAVAVDGDTAVVGSATEAAYIFVKTGGTWTQQAILEGYDPNSVDGFGLSVSISGDIVVVGASLDDSSSSTIDSGEDDDSASHAGAAYVFQRLGTAWGQVAYLKASDAAAGDQFGGAVAVDGDTIVVGAKWRDSAAGAAYVFVRDGEDWSEQAMLKASNTEALDQFGSSVSVEGDSVVVGAPEESDSGTDAGAAYVFSRNGATWTEEFYLKASNTDAHDQFGVAVGVSGNSIVIGSNQESSDATGVNGDEGNNGNYNGAAYAFEVTLAPPPVLDITRPRVRLLKKKRLKKARPRQRIKGRAQDDVSVARVEVKVSGSGWKKAKLRSSGVWIFRTPRLKSGRNVIKVRAHDTSGKRSKNLRVRASGR